MFSEINKISMIRIIMVLCAFLTPVFLQGENRMKGSKRHNEEIQKRIEDARERRGDHYADLLMRFIEETPRQKPGGVVFLGDSITEQFPLEQTFPEQNVINRGIGGDKVTGVIERLDVSSENLKPAKIYLLIGINDILWNQGLSEEDFLEEYDHLLRELKKSAPETDIYVQSILPVSGQFEEAAGKVKKLNSSIKKLASKHDLEYIDLFTPMSDASGHLRTAYTSDGVHLTLKGYLKWLEVILDRDEFFNAAVSLGPLWKKRHGTSFPVNAVDAALEGKYPGNRGPDEMIIYTPKTGRQRTGTNQWGLEAIIENGIVTKIGGNDNPIPENGFVASGHGDAATWISVNVRPGMKASYDSEIIKIELPPASDMSGEQLMETVREHYFNLVADLSDKKSEKARFEAARTLLNDIHKVEKQEDKNVDELKKILKKIDTLKSVQK